MHIQSDFDFEFNNPDEKEADIGKKDKKISAVKFPLNQVKYYYHCYHYYYYYYHYYYYHFVIIIFLFIS